jgi:hypothetical protein
MDVENAGDAGAITGRVNSLIGTYRFTRRTGN